MSAKIFVGNLSWNATEETLKELFAQFGEIISVRIVTDPYTDRSKGFGFIEMSDEGACSQAVEKLDNYSFLNRPIRVSRARQEGAGNGRPTYGSPRTGGGGMRGPYSGPRTNRSYPNSQYDEQR